MKIPEELRLFQKKNRNTYTGARNMMKIPENFDKLSLWIQEYTPDKTSLVELKNEMFMELYDEELIEIENKIKAVQDRSYPRIEMS